VDENHVVDDVGISEMSLLTESSSDLQWCVHFIMRAGKYEHHVNDYQSLERVLGYMEKQGFDVERRDILQIRECPGLVQTKSGGFALFLKRDAQHVWVEYPRFGKATYPLVLFDAYFEPNIYVITRRQTYDFKKKLSSQLFKMACQRWFRSPWIGGLILCCMVLYEGLSLIEPLFLNIFIQHVSVMSTLKDMAFGAGLLALILILGLVMGFYRHRLWVYFFGQCAIDVNHQMFHNYLKSHLVALTKQDMHDAYTRIGALEQITYRLLQQFFYVLLEMVFIGLHGWVMFYCQPTLAMWDMVFLLLMGVCHYFGMKQSFEQSQHVQVKQQTALALLMENMSSVVQIKLFESEVVFFKRWWKHFTAYWQDFLKLENKQLQIEWWMTFIKKMNWFVCLISAIYFLNQQTLTLGILVAYLSIKALVFGKAESLFKRLLQWQYIKAPLVKIQQIFLALDKKENQKLWHDTQDILLKNIKIHGVQLKDIHFVYGKKYILSGVSGCGKTTLLKMLMGVFPCDGEIYFPRQQRMNQEMVFVQQDDILWNTSLLNNITVFEQIINNDRLDDVLEIVDMMHWKSRLQEEPIHLSGGQKQRILIARALYRQPKWLILDESTCHLDEDSEHVLIKKLCQLPITVLMVNHRQETHAYFDDVIEWDVLSMGL